jgi:hypothetical protein
MIGLVDRAGRSEHLIGLDMERTMGNNAKKDKSKEKNKPNYCFENPIR